MHHQLPPRNLSFCGQNERQRVHLQFRVPFQTQWGQIVVLCGSGALLGNFNPAKGHTMHCHHEKDVLVWEVGVLLPWQPSYTYNYCIVRQGEDGVIVEKSEVAKRIIPLHEGLCNGDIVLITDVWLDRSHPSSILASGAFINVIKSTRPGKGKSPPSIERLQPGMGEAIVRLRITDLVAGPDDVVCVSGSIPALGNWQLDQMVSLTEVDSHCWEGELRVPYCHFPFTYKYVIQPSELATTAAVRLASSLGHPPPKHGHSIPAAGAITTIPAEHPNLMTGTISAAVSTSASVAMASLGSAPTAAAATASSVSVAAAGIGMSGGDLPALLEVGEPRIACLTSEGSTEMGAPAMVICHDGYFRREQLWRGAGIAIPVFSLRTLDSVGVGEFLDLIKLIDMAEKCGMRMIQVLPINDTCVYNMWWDSYPYSTISVHALHPQYLALRALRADLPVDLGAEIDAARGRLEGRHVDYEGVIAAKMRIAKQVYNRFGREVTDSNEFKEWVEENSYWLRPYAAFVLLRDLFQSAEHWEWGLLGRGTMENVTRLTSPTSDHFTKINFTYWLQFQLHKQLKMVSDYAASKRVILKGDIPIGVDKRSVDTWMDPHLFRMDKSTGAPPDCFDPNGQNWGFPTYNWEAMAQDGYSWWKRRLKHMAQYFHAYRIDHILGFFRIWEIPGDCTSGILGHFRPSIPVWRHELEERGVTDINRLCDPYIRTHLLRQLFGERSSEVSARYMVEYAPDCFNLRPEYSSESQIAAIKVREGSPDWLLEETEQTRKGLLKLRQNVVMLRDPEDNERFYPRFNLTKTSSFKELPGNVRGALSWLHDDYYFRRQEDTWRAAALSKLPAIMQASDMLVCGEDLGLVPECVPPVMQELGLVGLRIQRMAVENGQEFNNPANYPYLTVASPSCHDVTPIRAWYESDGDRRDRFFYTMLGGCGTPPKTCTPDIVRIIVQQHLACPSVWAVFPMQDIMALSSKYTHGRPALEEVINDPTVSKHYWRFRMHVPLEDMLADSQLMATLQEMLLISGRTTPKDLPRLS